MTGRYIPYSPRTRKALEAIGDIKMMIARKREARRQLYTDINQQKSNEDQQRLHSR